jgi:hypothetical protein
MYTYITMSHRTQIILPDSQYARLKRESERTGISLGELIRRSVAIVYGQTERDTAIKAVKESAGIWSDWDIDGAEYVDSIRRGMAHRLESQ